MAIDPSLYQALGNLPGGSQPPPVPQPSAPVAPPPGGPAAGSLYGALGALPTSAPMQPQNLQLGPQVADASDTAQSFIDKLTRQNSASANADKPHRPTADEIRAKNAKNFGR